MTRVPKDFPRTPGLSDAQQYALDALRTADGFLLYGRKGWQTLDRTKLPAAGLNWVAMKSLVAFGIVSQVDHDATTFLLGFSADGLAAFVARRPHRTK